MRKEDDKSTENENSSTRQDSRLALIDLRIGKLLNEDIHVIEIKQTKDVVMSDLVKIWTQEEAEKGKEKSRKENDVKTVRQADNEFENENLEVFSTSQGGQTSSWIL